MNKLLCKIFGHRTIAFRPKGSWVAYCDIHFKCNRCGKEVEPIEFSVIVSQVECNASDVIKGLAEWLRN